MTLGYYTALLTALPDGSVGSAEGSAAGSTAPLLRCRCWLCVHTVHTLMAVLW
jgi:hypothetical protein